MLPKDSIWAGCDFPRREQRTLHVDVTSHPGSPPRPNLLVSSQGGSVGAGWSFTLSLCPSPVSFWKTWRAAAAPGASPSALCRG